LSGRPGRTRASGEAAAFPATSTTLYRLTQTVERAVGALADILGWDVVNWSQGLKFFESRLPARSDDSCALELGCGSAGGGLSLWLALKNFRVTCSGHREVSEVVKSVHVNYGVHPLVSYEAVDALATPYVGHFDVICFKSMLGGIVCNGSMKSADKAVAEIKRALKPGGKLLFAENLQATQIHHKFRKRYGAGKHGWRYFTISEICALLSQFTCFEYTTFGFLGCFGWSEAQRRVLGTLDTRLVARLVPSHWRYVLAGVATK
jgi:SAM-dependent methyltransferase